MKTIFLALMALIVILFVLSFQPKKTGAEATDVQLSEGPVQAFITSLRPEQRKKAIMPLDDESRELWHYLPGASWDRAGIQLKELDKSQQALAFALLKAQLSESGYQKVTRIIALEDVLADFSNNPEYRDPEKYYIAFYGEPLTAKTWTWSFEGHHISLNFSIHGDKIAMVPRFLGANPGIVPRGPKKGEQVLKKEEDLGFALLNALNASQKSKAIIQDIAPREILTTNQAKVSPFAEAGIRVGEMTRNQQSILVKLLRAYLEIMPKELAKARLDVLQQEAWEDIRFAWAGATQPGIGHYYRIQGNSF